ncbi:type II toxin-antitoxin system death-on-curing family toxin [Bacillus infantis]|jgi:death on curing protein|uniref:type II toxin-antitoxin system death-on-curing family toxin n=1 Tax=Bacillus infantis TaxID=324767 RepID=UPI001CD21686|nr:type II toxin-antitoxin system death-on-curing family toxin [Bacillus infantis]MCA1042042.1 type II toxin-antitoxin system death-on-curing family toxin [Bacillus infantis]
MEVRYLTVKEVIFLNHHQIKAYTPGEMMGVKDMGMLESAVERPRQSVLGRDAYDTLELKAAALYQSLAKNHPFHNANKRTAFASLYMFLRLNGKELDVPPKLAEDFTVNIVTDKSIGLHDIAVWIEDFIQKD